MNESEKAKMSEPTRTIVFKYGLMPPKENRALFDAQMRLGAEYHNALREVEQQRRVRYQAAVEALRPSDLAATVERLKNELATARAAIRSKRALKRSAKTDDAAATNVATLKIQLDEAWRKLRASAERIQVVHGRVRDRQREAKAETPASQCLPALEDPALENAVQAILASEAQFDRDYLATRTAFRAKGLYVGTYQIIEQTFKATRLKMPIRHWRRGYDGTGRVGVYVGKPVKVEDVLSGRCAHLQIDGERVATWNGGRRVKTSLRLRIGSDQSRGPIWAPFEMCYHRPLPPGSTWQFAWIKRTRVAGHEKYEVNIVLKIPANALLFQPRGDGAGGRVAVDLGWRVTPRGLRVAYWVGDDGASGEVLVPSEVRGQLDKADSLRSIRDRLFDAAKGAVQAWFAENPPSEELAPLLVGLPQWRSPKKMVRLLRAWCSAERFSLLQGVAGRSLRLIRELVPQMAAAARAQPWAATALYEELKLRPHAPIVVPLLRTLLRLNDEIEDRAFQNTDRLREFIALRAHAMLSEDLSSVDVAVLPVLLAWAAQDQHLWEWEANARLNAIGTRRKVYRTLANKLAARYSALVLEDFDLRAFAREPAAEDGSRGVGNAQRSTRTDAAPSELRAALEWSFERCGRSVRRIDPARTTLDHFACSQPFAADPAPASQVLLKCDRCGLMVDQDENAARALLKRDSQ